MNLFKKFFAAGRQPQLASGVPAAHNAALQVTADAPTSEGASTSTGTATKQRQVVRALRGSANGVVPAPKVRVPSLEGAARFGAWV